MSIKKFNKFKKQAIKFKVQDTYFFDKMVKMGLCAAQLIILLSAKLSFSNYMMKAAIKEEKTYTIELLISIGWRIYIWKKKLIYKPVKNVNAEIVPDQRKPCIQFRLFFYSKNQAQTQFICRFFRAFSIQQLPTMTYQAEIRQKLYAVFFLELLRIFYRKTLSIGMAILRN